MLPAVARAGARRCHIFGSSDWPFQGPKGEGGDGSPGPGCLHKGTRTNPPAMPGSGLRSASWLQLLPAGGARRGRMQSVQRDAAGTPRPVQTFPFDFKSRGSGAGILPSQAARPHGTHLSGSPRGGSGCLRATGGSAPLPAPSPRRDPRRSGSEADRARRGRTRSTESGALGRRCRGPPSARGGAARRGRLHRDRRVTVRVTVRGRLWAVTWSRPARSSLCGHLASSPARRALRGCFPGSWPPEKPGPSLAVGSHRFRFPARG